jgi:16S rRNA (adenine1518-N6/adenine1519-N6)-dimethyltransferase
VDSALLKLEPRPRIERAAYPRLKALTRMLFAHRRKTWVNSLKTYFKGHDLGPLIAGASGAGIDPGARAQQLSREKIMELCRILAPLVDETGEDI